MDERALRWFGESWGAPVCDPRTHIETPVGKLCKGHDHTHKDWDDQVIREGDQGVTVPYQGPDGVKPLPYHLDCWLHEIGADRLI